MAPKKKSLPPEMDPVFPLIAGFGLPPVEHLAGKQIMKRTESVTVVLPYRAFYFLWEYAEREGARQYPKYVGTQLDHAAQTWLDAVHSMRSAAVGVEIKRYPEEKAQKARALLAKHAKAVAEKAKAARAAAKGQNDAPEGATDEPALPSGSRSKARKGAGESSGARKATRKPSRATKKVAARKPSAGKASKRASRSKA